MRSVPVESIPGTMRNSRLPLNEVTRIKRVRWYRSPIEPQALRRLMQRSDLQGWLQAGGNLALFAATATLTWYLFLQQAWVGLRTGALPALHVRQLPVRRLSRAGPRHGVQDQAAQPRLPAHLRAAGMVQLPRLRP